MRFRAVVEFANVLPRHEPAGWLLDLGDFAPTSRQLSGDRAEIAITVQADSFIIASRLAIALFKVIPVDLLQRLEVTAARDEYRSTAIDDR